MASSSLVRRWAREGEFDGGGSFGERDLGGDGVVVGRHLVPRHADPARRQHGERGGQSDVGGPVSYQGRSRVKTDRTVAFRNKREWPLLTGSQCDLMWK